MRILITDDSKNWVEYHKSAIFELYPTAKIDEAFSAQEGIQKLMLSIDKPYDIILTDMQMESDFLPLFAGEWFIKQIKFFKEYKNTKIFIISATSNIKQIAQNYGTDYIPKYMCKSLEAYKKIFD